MWKVLLAALGGLCAAVVHAQTSIVFWNSQQASDSVERIAQGFARESGIKVDVNWFSHPEYKAALLRHAAEGDLPDVALVAADFLANDKELKFSVIPGSLPGKNLLEGARDAGVFEGRRLGVPLFWGNHLVLYYNRGLVNRPAATFEEIERQKPAFVSRGVQPLAMNFGELYWFTPFLVAFGGWPMANDHVTLNTSSMAEALTYYFGLADRGLVPKTCRSDCVTSRFIAGEFAYAINGDWAFRDLKQKMGEQLGVALLPRIGSRPLVPMSSAYVLVFPNDSLNGPKRQALLRFAQYLTSTSVQRLWFKETELLPVDSAAFTAVTRSADENLKASLEQLKRSRPMPNDRGMAFAWEGMAKGFSALYRGRADAKLAAIQMQAHADKVAQRAGE